MPGYDGLTDGPLGGAVASAPAGYYKVRAIALGTSSEYGQMAHYLRRPGDEFIVKQDQFSAAWMVRLDDKTPPPVLPDPATLPQTTIQAAPAPMGNGFTQLSPT